MSEVAKQQTLEESYPGLKDGLTASLGFLVDGTIHEGHGFQVHSVEEIEFLEKGITKLFLCRARFDDFVATLNASPSVEEVAKKQALVEAYPGINDGLKADLNFYVDGTVHEGHGFHVYSVREVEFLEKGITELFISYLEKFVRKGFINDCLECGSPPKPGTFIRTFPNGSCIRCGRPVSADKPVEEAPKRIDSIEDLETKFEEFIAELNASASVKAIITVKLREASRWIGDHCMFRGFI